jgi:hypothetical protein
MIWSDGCRYGTPNKISLLHTAHCTMIHRCFLSIVFALSFAACASYKTGLVNGKVAIYPIEQKDYSEALRMMVDASEKFSTEMVALAPKQEGKSSGSLTIKPWWGLVEASGKLEDGSIAQGSVLGDRFSCRGKELYPGQRQKFKELHDRMTQELAAKFKSRWEPQYVVPETLKLQ